MLISINNQNFYLNIFYFLHHIPNIFLKLIIFLQLLKNLIKLMIKMILMDLKIIFKLNLL